MRIIIAEPPNTTGVHKAKCTHSGGSFTISSTPAPRPTRVPIMEMAKNAGPSAVSNFEKSMPHFGQLFLIFMNWRKIPLLPQLGHRHKIAAFQRGFWVLIMAHAKTRRGNHQA